MKKLIAIIFGSMLLFSTHAAAELAIGVTANFASIDTDGSETELTGDTERTTASVSDDVVIPEVFVEAVNENGLAFGVSYIPARELGNKKRIDKNGDDAAENDDGDYTAKADLSNVLMVYTDIPIGPIYVKLGFQRAEILTKELLDDTVQYEDAHVNGYTAGIGYRGNLGDAFYKLEVAYTDFDEYKDTSESGTATVAAETEITSVRASLGFAF